MKIAIVGGGAAGLMAAATAQKANPTAEIVLIERNDGLGKKVIISGGGRCNVTTGITDVREVLLRYPRGGKFLLSAMHVFPPDQVREWFESHGVPLKTEEDLRVFPQSDNGEDVVRVFERLFQNSNVEVLLRAAVIRIEKTEKVEGCFSLFFKDTEAPLVVDRVILTTGGQAYRHTGSTGDGYSFALSLGHSITPLAASLNAFFTTETWPAEISGLSFERATITAKRLSTSGNTSSMVGNTGGSAKESAYTGPFLFTHKGVTGPAVFAVSSLVAFQKYDRSQPLEIEIDLFPDQSSEELRATLEAAAQSHLKKSFVNSLIGIIPKSLSEILCQQLALPPEKKAAEVSKKDLLRCVEWLKGIPLHVVARGAGDEFVTAGGVELKEVNPATMESKICPGLFFAGEILDIDGFTGGFNLQASWATGYVAGESVTRTSLVSPR